MDQELLESNLKLTERPNWSFGFSLREIIFAIGLVVVTQLVRVVVLWQEWPVFKNPDFAFSLNVPTPIIYLLHLIVFGVMLWYLKKHWTNLQLLIKIGFIFILAGGISNLLERIYFGFVIDYIYILNGVLNLADGYIFLGVLLVFVSRTNSEKI